ncbi:MAG: AbgT family transporter, partial [Phycisphaerales bacterium]|nr:AbgT family transporter [Phycisphaerales bacterium]
MTASKAASRSGMQKVLDVVERVGNRVPHPAVIFLMLIGATIILAQVLQMFGASVTYEVLNPETHGVDTVTT